MNFIILIVIAVFIGLIALLFIVALFTHKTYTVNREIIINRPKQQVFAYVKQLKNQEEYNKWWNIDPNAKKDYIGVDGTVGFTAYWDSDNNKVGKGEQEIKKITEGQRIDYELRFIRPFKGVSQTFISTADIENKHTIVNWNFSGAYKYPANILLLLMDMDKMLGSDIHISLTRLKNAVENKYLPI